MSYYILLQGQQAGPYTEDHLRMFLSAGQVKATDLVWREGLAEWAPLSAVLPDLVAPLSASARKPVPTPRQEAPARVEPVRESAAAEPKATKPAQPAEVEEGDGNPLKKWLIIGGIVVALVVIALGSAIGWYVYESSKYDASSKAYVDNYVTHVAPDWSSQDFVNHVAEPYRTQFKRENLDHLFEVLAHFGSLKQYNGSSGESHVSVRSLGKSVTAQYEAHATFDRGDLTFNLQLLLYQGQWTIAGIRVDSPLFHKHDHESTSSPASTPAPPQ